MRAAIGMAGVLVAAGVVAAMVEGCGGGGSASGARSVLGPSSGGGGSGGGAGGGGPVGGGGVPGGGVPGGGTPGGGTPGGGTPGGGGGAPTTIYYTEDFEGALPGFQLSFQGNTPFVAGTPANGPGGAAQGARCLAVTLAPNTDNNLFAVAASAPFSLAGAVAPVLKFSHAFDIETGIDGARIYVRSSTGTLTVVEPFRGYSRAMIDQTFDAGFTGLSGSAALPAPASGAPKPRPAWVEDRFDLAPFAGQTGLEIVFDFETNSYNTSGTWSSSSYAGWFVDDLVVGEAAAIGAASAPYRPQPVVDEDFEGAPLFAVAGNFEIAAPPAGVGPGGPLSGSRCAGTSLVRYTVPGPSDTQGRYPNNVGAGGGTGGMGSGGAPDRLATSAAVALPAGTTEAILAFSHFYDLENRYDGGRIAVAASAAGPWTALEARERYPAVPSAFLRWSSAAGAGGFTGETVGWKRASVDLTPAIALHGTSFFVAFEFATDSSNFQKFDGWFLDDVQVFAK